jgi:hypothetical protein
VDDRVVVTIDARAVGVDVTFNAGVVTVVEGPNGRARYARPAAAHAPDAAIHHGSRRHAAALRVQIGARARGDDSSDLTGIENLQLYARAPRSRRRRRA